MMNVLILLVTILIVVGTTTSYSYGSSTPLLPCDTNIVYDSSYDGYKRPFISTDNGSFYHYIHDPCISWVQAEVAAESHTYLGIQGHLATMTTEFENLFVQNLLPEGARAWVGLTDELGEGDFKWVTGEPLRYTNWDPVQPDNYNNEDFVELLQETHNWNDLPNYSSAITGYVVEYTPGPVLNPENGHYYKYVSDHHVTWQDAKQFAEDTIHEEIYGHLVTITSESENAFVNDIVPYYGTFWIGLTDEDIEGDYRWVTGEPYSYSSWAVNQPDDYNDNEDYIESYAPTEKWNDIDYNYTINGYVIEYTPYIQNPENGHYYRFMEDTSKSWWGAEYAAQSYSYKGNQGYLATIHSQQENDFVKSLIEDHDTVWLGGHDITTNSYYQWVKVDPSNNRVEPFNYTNWQVNQPDNYGNQEFYLSMYGHSGEWNDLSVFDNIITGYIIEFSE